MYKRPEKLAAFILLLILIMSLLPVMYLGRYNCPTGDDYFYGADAHNVWEATGSIAATVKEAAKGVIHDYKTWQGTYSAMFFMRLSPNIFSETAYRYVTTVLLLMLTTSIFFVSKPLICKCLNASKELWIIISSLICLICVQIVPTQGETFFWYNGSMYYTGYFALTLFLLGLVIRYLINMRWQYIPVSVILAAVIAGGNYVSLLPAIVIMVLVALGLGFKKEYRRCSVIASVAAILLLGLAISALAPGNAVRQQELWQIPAWKAVLKSLLQGIRYMWAWMRGWWWITVAIATPFFIKSFRGITLRFRYPLIVTGLAYGIFCSMSCPTFYSMNSTGPTRVVAIVYYGFILTTFFCYYYWLGYIYQKCRNKAGKSFQDSGNVDKKITMIVSVIALVLFIGQCFNGNIHNCTTVKTIKLLATGEAEAYGNENTERLRLLNDENVTDVILKPHEHTPDMLYVGDLLDDPSETANQKMAQFYGKNSVIVDWSGQ